MARSGWLPDIPNPVSALGGVIKRNVPKAAKTIIGTKSYDAWNPFNNNDEAAKRSSRAAAAARRVRESKYELDQLNSLGKMTPYVSSKMKNAIIAANAHTTPTTALTPFGPDIFADPRMISASIAAQKAMGGVGGQGGTGRTGGTGSRGPSGPSGPSQADILHQMYADLIARVGGMGDESVAGFAKGKEAVKQNYATAAEDLYKRYERSKAEMVGAGQTLGVDQYDDSGTQAILKRIQETGDLASATDQSWFDKMGPLQKDLFAQLAAGIQMDELARQQELRQQQMAAAARRARIAAAGRGGGGSGSGKTTLTDVEKAALMMDQKNIGLSDDISRLAPRDKLLFDQGIRNAGGSLSGLSTEMGNIINAPIRKTITTSMPNMSKFKRMANEVAKQQQLVKKAAARRVQDVSYPYLGTEYPTYSRSADQTSNKSTRYK